MKAIKLLIAIPTHATTSKLYSVCLFNLATHLAKVAMEKSERQVRFPQADSPTKTPRSFFLNFSIAKELPLHDLIKSPHTYHRPFLWLHFHHFYFFVR